MTYVNIAGTFYYLSAILDGATRFLVHSGDQAVFDKPAAAPLLRRYRAAGAAFGFQMS
ncbi:MAG: hypothetical protein L0Z62_11375 [Gemmataceae bacterium]|nr:hypothetical protein [Gemmataceae bacterium]